MIKQKKLTKHLAENKIEYSVARIISSDLPRAITTAGYISTGLGLPILEEPLIRETNNGDLLGMLNEEALVKYPGLFFSSLETDEPYPNGKSPKEFYKRIKTWFENFLVDSKKSNGNIPVVTHGGVINIIYHIIKKVEWSNKGSSFKVSNCSIHILSTDTMELEMENKVDFLE